jgi:CheY-like chemotaxis protein
LDDVLDLARIEAGKLMIHPRGFDLGSMLRGILTFFELQASQRQIDLRLHISEDLPVGILADPDRFRQILVNFTSNALKFTETGFVEIRAFPQDGSLRIEVEDSGIGVEASRLEGLWEAFEQVDNSNARKHGGTGLGLNIVRRLVELMDGSFGAQSSPGAGSKFWFQIPLVEVAIEDAERPVEECIGGRTGRILLAEDNPINRRVLSQQLGGLGYEISEASNGLEAIELMEESEFDLVLMDCQMPELDGYETTTRLRMKGYNIPILALTAHAMSGERARCLQSGMDDHLAKPLSRDDLARALSKWMPAER